MMSFEKDEEYKLSLSLKREKKMISMVKNIDKVFNEKVFGLKYENLC